MSFVRWFGRKLFPAPDDTEAKPFSKKTTAEELRAISTAFVDGLDRTVLGRFAVPRDVLISTDMFLRVTSSPVLRNLFLNARDVRRDSFSGDEARRLSMHHGLMFSASQHEALFWWRAVPDPLWSDQITYGSKLITNSLDTLSAIVSHPDMHDYFAAGLWDVDFIERCILGDMDTELAVALYEKTARAKPFALTDIGFTMGYRTFPSPRFANDSDML